MQQDTLFTKGSLTEASDHECEHIPGLCLVHLENMDTSREKEQDTENYRTGNRRWISVEGPSGMFIVGIVYENHFERRAVIPFLFRLRSLLLLLTVYIS
jgi:hypothetical protein